MEKLISYFRLSRAELSKVIFPLPMQVKSAFIAVFSVVTVITLFLALVDLLMSYSISSVIN
ncbi:MAG: preprotein translocase subunit SecE [Helicobacteraceae bacterium]|jgi:preprotein translocase subunit SecE|nr:preprotein translocase subunit SecE [Helicobacteraceae bacterium]MDR2034220.1 preprotein translocase subunit SecE [Helicobacteraceae bacterium]